LSIAQKEASETEYWIELLYSSEFLSKEQYESLMIDCKELMKIPASIIKTSKKNNT